MYGDGCDVVVFFEARIPFHVRVGGLLTVDIIAQTVKPAFAGQVHKA